MFCNKKTPLFQLASGEWKPGGIESEKRSRRFIVKVDIENNPSIKKTIRWPKQQLFNLPITNPLTAINYNYKLWFL